MYVEYKISKRVLIWTDPQQNVEMGRIGTPNKDYAAPPSKDYSAGPYGNAQLQNHQQPSATDTRPILEQCSAISSEIRKLQEPNGSIDRIKRAHKVYAARDDTNVLREIDEETDLVKRQLRGMTERIKEVETLPGMLTYSRCRIVTNNVRLTL